MRQVIMHPIYRRRAAPRRDTQPTHELWLYNGLITLPHFREALSRWGHLLSNLAPRRQAKRLGV